MACNTYMYIKFVLFAVCGIGFWSLNKLSKMGETFYSSENSIKIIQNNFKEKRPPLAHP